MRPQPASFSPANGMPKTHKHFTDLPTFRPIIDTTTTPRGVTRVLELWGCAYFMPDEGRGCKITKGVTLGYDGVYPQEQL